MEIITHTDEEIGVILTYYEADLILNVMGYIVTSRCQPSVDESMYYQIKAFYDRTNRTYPVYDFFVDHEKVNDVSSRIYSMHYKEHV